MENQNSVAFIAKINSITSIEGADKIELAQVEGWTSIVQKGIHKPGDLVLCLTTDAVIPDGLAEKWGCKNYLRKGNRVRTIKLKGVYSECILIPSFDIIGRGNYQYREGLDLMKDLNIFKYEPPIQEISIPGIKQRKVKYQDNPNFHIYYKFPNQKNVPSMFNEHDFVVITNKIHGTNARYGFCKKTKTSILDRIKKFFGNKWAEYEFVYGSHHVEKGSDSQGFYSVDHWFNINQKYKLKELIINFCKQFKTPEEIGSGYILHGEIYGPGIQGEKYTYGEKETKFKAFDIEIDGKYVGDLDFVADCRMMGIPTVAYLYKGFWKKEIQDELLDRNIPGTKTPEEGIVVKDITGDRKKVSKVINPNYLIFSEKHEIPDSH